MLTAEAKFQEKLQAGEPLRRRLTKQELALYERVPAEVEFVDHESFTRSDTEEQLFHQAEKLRVPAWAHFPEVPEDIHAVVKHRAALKPKEEALLFLRYNYARYRLSQLVIAQLRRQAAGRARQILRWFAEVLTARSDVVNANMALVLAMAKRTRIPNVEFNDLVSEGNMALLRAVEKFDVARGFKFSTYACRAILKSFNRLASKTGRYRSRFPVEFDPDLERSDHEDTKHDLQHEDAVGSLQEILVRNRAHLSRIEERIVRERFALNKAGRKRTLAEVGKMVGLTNERVRQLQNLALGKLRSVLDRDYLVA